MYRSVASKDASALVWTNPAMDFNNLDFVRWSLLEH